MNCRCLTLSLCAALTMLVAQIATAAPNTQYFQQIDPAVPTHSDVSDFSPTGLNLGNEGFAFFNWDQSAPSIGPVALNVYDSMPSWLQFDYDPNSPTYSFGDDPGLEAYSKGGFGYSTLTLPDGTTGESGALVDPAAEDNSNNTIPRLTLGAGAPDYFWVHYVTDNTNGDHNSVDRLRAREEDGNTDVRLRNLSFNSEPDVYSFFYTGMLPGNYLKLQLNSGVPGVQPSIAGIMIDIPEPTSMALVMLGSIGLIVRRRR